MTFSHEGASDVICAILSKKITAATPRKKQARFSNLVRTLTGQILGRMVRTHWRTESN
jgi:hypothetical protein